MSIHPFECFCARMVIHTAVRSENKESEDSSLFPHYAPVAQLVEQEAFNFEVDGSNPSGRTNTKLNRQRELFE